MKKIKIKEIINKAIKKIYYAINVSDYFLKGKVQCNCCSSPMKKITIIYIKNKKILKKERYICKTYNKSNGILCKNKGIYASKVLLEIENKRSEEYEKIKFYLDYIENLKNNEQFLQLKRNLNVLYLKEEDRYKYYKTVSNNLLNEFKLGLLTYENYNIIKKEFDSEVKKQKIYLEKLVFIKDNINNNNSNLLNLKNNDFKSTFRNIKNIEKIYIENKEIIILKNDESKELLQFYKVLKEIFDSQKDLYIFENTVV